MSKHEILDYLHLLFDKYKAASRGSLVWCMLLLTFTVAMFWMNFRDIGEWPAKVIIAIIGMLSTVLVFYEKRNKP